MASHHFAIAKASFSAGLLRPDPTSLSREDIAHFHLLLNAAIVQCTPVNVQKCKQWILENIVQSTARLTALGKYLTALTTSFAESAPQLDSAPTKRDPSIKRRRLHLLYIVNDILHHAKYRVNDASINVKIQTMLVNLLESAASFGGCPKHHGKILDLLQIWEEKGYYSRDYIDKLRETVRNASELKLSVEGRTDVSDASADKGSAAKITKTAPFVMPAMHGDASTPWFDLPAGNLMPHIMPNSTRPINPEMIKPLLFVAGPAHEGLVVAVRTLLDDVQNIFGVEPEQDDWVSADIDELGQPITVDEITGDVIEGEGYYGWSRTFCEKMRRRQRDFNIPGRDEDRGRTSRSRSSSRYWRKRRHSDSDDGSSQSWHGRTRPRHSYSSSRSPSPDSDRRAFHNGSSRSRSRNRSRSGTPRCSPSTNQRQSESGPISRPRNHLDSLPPKPPSQSKLPMVFQQDLNPNFPPPPPPFQNAPFNPSQWPLQGQPPFHDMYLNASGPQPSWPPPPPTPPPNYPPNFQQHSGGIGRGGWQPPTQADNGRGFNNGWHHGPPGLQQGRGTRGSYRGRGW